MFGYLKTFLRYACIWRSMFTIWKKTVAGCVECLPYFNYLFYCLCMSSFLKKVRENTIWFKGINHSHLLNWVKNVLNSSFVDCKTEICQPTRRQIVCSTWKQGFLFFLVFFFWRGGFSFPQVLFIKSSNIFQVDE